MEDRTNTIAGWALAGGIAALGLSIVSGMIYHNGRPDKMGYPIEGVEEAGEGGGGAAAVPLATRLADADLAKGEASFKKCVACHTIAQGGANGIGPNLYGVVGKPHGHIAGFAFTDALKSVPGNWTFEALDEWLTSPRKYAPGTKMTFAGVPDGQERANIIAYMNAQGSNLPLPAAAPAAAAPAEANATAPAETGNLSNQASPATGAPSVDPQAAVQAEKKGH
ncbi:c-type cytochrome [Sphingomonas soli]|uniref:c-type cytochrome n=1 Tax=Sphingomonas soli TaxID=266127 RepID=UPI0008352A9F|nr:cytochrome c family protein [Sphingomonas soli]